MRFTTTLQTTYVLEANASGMNTAKNQQNPFWIKKNNEKLKTQ